MKKNGGKMRIGVLASGGGTNLQAIIDAAEAGKIRATVSVVICDNSEAFALDRARKHKIPAVLIERGKFVNRTDFENAIADGLKKYRVELVCLAGFMRMLSPVFLSAFLGRVINIHPALLPSFPGLDAQRQAFDYGVKISGCTVHFVDEKMDHGPIILQKAVPVREDDTAESLKERILKEEHRIYPEAISMIAGGKIEIAGRRVKIKG